MFWLQIASNFVKILREGQTPNQIAAGFALGAIVGLTPMVTLQGAVLWLIILTFNINLSAVFLSAALFGILGAIFDPVFHDLGYYLLTGVDGLTPIWTSLYNAPIAPLTRFNNTIVMGSLAAALVLCVPAYLAMNRFVILYRATLGRKISTNKFYVALKQSRLVRWYERVRDFGGGS